MSDQFQPSELGTKEHWDNVYSQELANFDEIGDEGEVWFGQDVLEKMRDWVLHNVPPTSNPFVLDIGSGNGNMLFELFDAGYDPTRLCGIDYSTDSIQLAQRIASVRQANAITFKAMDFLLQKPEHLRDMNADNDWNLVLDKGTLDAMVLAAHHDDRASPSEIYPVRVGEILKSGGYLLITSCNFTEEELQQKFVTPSTGLAFHSRLHHPTISFGGQTGSTYATVAFVKTS